MAPADFISGHEGNSTAAGTCALLSSFLSAPFHCPSQLPLVILFNVLLCQLSNLELSLGNYYDGCHQVQVTGTRNLWILVPACRLSTRHAVQDQSRGHDCLVVFQYPGTIGRSSALPSPCQRSRHHAKDQRRIRDDNHVSIWVMKT
jgi:hypothetical protein